MRITTLIFEYRCSVCWSPLVERDGQPICAKYGSDHKGYHRRTGVEWAQEHSEYDRREVIALYQDVPPFSYMLGLATPPHAVSMAQLQINRRALGRDDSGF